MSKQDDLLDTVQRVYKLLYEAKMAWSEGAARIHRLAARNILEDAVGRIGEEGELK